MSARRSSSPRGGKTSDTVLDLFVAVSESLLRTLLLECIDTRILLLFSLTQ